MMSAKHRRALWSPDRPLSAGCRQKHFEILSPTAVIPGYQLIGFKIVPPGAILAGFLIDHLQ